MSEKTLLEICRDFIAASDAVMSDASHAAGLRFYEAEKAMREAIADAPAPSDTERLDWLDKNPRSVTYSQGYLDSKSGWTWRDEHKAGQDASNLRAAIDAAMQSK